MKVIRFCLYSATIFYLSLILALYIAGLYRGEIEVNTSLLWNLNNTSPLPFLILLVFLIWRFIRKPKKATYRSDGVNLHTIKVRPTGISIPALITVIAIFQWVVILASVK